MARSTAKVEDNTSRRNYWADEIAKSDKRYSTFVSSGERVQDRYRLEIESDNGEATLLYQDRYNILYSSTETTKPSLYAQTPKVQAVKRHRDRENEYVTLATMLLEAAGQYALEEVDFDGVMKNVVQDFLLPGMGVAWVRYTPKFRPVGEADKDGNQPEEISFEGLDVDYVHYKDFRTGVGRTWKELPWIARRVYFTKAQATKRWGKEKADKLKYSFKGPNDDANGNRDMPGSGGAQAIIYEIWDKVRRKVVWFSNDYPVDVIEELDDPLRLNDFWPCPEPIRAVWTTRTFIPKAFYSQYKAQAEELDNITKRIRLLTDALRVIGLYDGSQQSLADLLQGDGNKMIAVDQWAVFAQQGGIQGSIQYVPIKEIAEVLMSLLQQRDVVKNEIYEITGFSDIVRGVSKASETLGAQQIKADWATGRLRDMQKEVQRFCRDIIRIMVEIMSEHFSEASLALYAGFDPPEVTPEEQAASAQYGMSLAQYQQTGGVNPDGTPMQPPQKPGPTAQQQAIETFKRTVQLLKSEKQRCASIGIETDSTIMPDEAAEREDRMQFLSSAGAFLQQAGPMALQFPDMRGLLGAILMFTIRTFRASRPLEKEFEEFTKKLAAAPAQDPNAKPGEGGDNGQAAAQAQVQGEQIKAQQAQQQAQMDADVKRYEIDKKAELEQQKLSMEHEYRMRELALREREVAIKEMELGVKQQQASTDAALAAQDQQHDHQMDREGLARQDEQFQAGREDADRNFEQQEREAKQNDA